MTLLFLGPIAHIQASDYYVAPAGSNGNPGTFENPWATIGHAVGEIGPGDTVYVRAGSYAERVQFNQSGTSTQPIVLRNFPGEIAAIDGSTLFVAATGAPDPLVAIRDQSHTVENLRILDCELHDLMLGTSEALVLNGNVTNFLVRGCTIRDSNNIAIDIIGHEGISANPTLDQARNGIVEDCEAHHAHSPPFMDHWKVFFDECFFIL